MYRIQLLCREGMRLVNDLCGMRWEYVWHWHTWTVEESYEEAAKEAARLRIDLNPMVWKLRIIGIDEPY